MIDANKHKTHDRIFLEQIRLLYSKNTTVLAGTIGISLAAVFVLWSPIGTERLLWWLALSLLVTSCRFFLARAFNKAELSVNNVQWWANAFVLGAVANALSWSVVPVFFFLPDQPLYVLFLGCLYAGYISGAVSSTSVHFPVFLGFALPASALFSARLFFEQDFIFTATGVMIWFYLAASISFARNNQRVLTDSIVLKFENTDLLDEVREQRDTARQAVKEKNHFLAATSHDLRQPLHALGLYVEAMETEVQVHAKHDTLQKIRESTDALTKQLHGLLDLSSIDANIIENRPKHFDISPVMCRLADEYTAQANKKQLSFEIEDSKQHIVYCDDTIFQRIVSNLLCNAVNHTKKGGVSIVFNETPDNKLLVMVSDTGPGIPEEEVDNIFKEYHQLRNPGRDRRLGLGLGLAIVKRLCLLADLKLELESTLGKGSTFKLFIPKGDVKQIQVNSLTTHFGHLDGVRVVVIDDDRDVVDGTCQMLQRWGCEPVGALDVSDALRQLNDESIVPDIVITDFRLADGKTGLDAIRLFQKRYEEPLKYLIITGETMPAELSAVKQAGTPILHKPVHPNELRSRLHQLLGDETT